MKRTVIAGMSFLARPILLFYMLPWLMFLLVCGTVAQRYIGLYQSEKLFFGSCFLWVGPVPLPGAYVTLAAIVLCLVVKLACKSPWRKSDLGIIITHASIVLLLLGGLITALCREEGYIILGPGDTGNIVSDYHLRELAILKNGRQIIAIPQTALYQGNDITSSALPFSLHIDQYCIHCTARARAHPDPRFKGIAQKLELIAASPRQEEAENQAAISFDVSGVSPAQDGEYVVSENIQQPTVIMKDKDRYEMIVRHARRELPFNLELLAFEKSDYPGTDMARSYRSQVKVKDGDLLWNTTIEMNHPLRHLGYTLYQSSFIEEGGRQYTVLAVVKNTGALFPYISMAALAIGLLVHLCIRFAPRGRL